MSLNFLAFAVSLIIRNVPYLARGSPRKDDFEGQEILRARKITETGDVSHREGSKLPLKELSNESH